MEQPTGSTRTDIFSGKRLECLLEQTPGEWHWTPGTVAALLLPQWPGWARVQFDSGDTLEVELPLESEGDAWRWADTAGSDSRDAMSSTDGGLAAALQNIKKELGPEPTAATSHTFVRATDSGLAAALYNIKKEPGQEPRPTNSRDEQRAAAPKDSDQAVADLAALAAPAGAIAAAAAAQQRATSAVPKHVRPVPGNDQGVDDELESREEEDCEPVAKRRKNCVTTSEFVGVCWNKSRRKWHAGINHDGKQQNLGSFNDEHEAARTVDTAARRLRGENAHGGRSKKGHWLRLNFPTEEEVKRAQERGALLTEEDRAAAASEQQRPSKFVGVSWIKKQRQWRAEVRHDGKPQNLGSFNDEHEAAQAVDTAARRLRGEDAHGGRSGRQWVRLNFPTQREVKRAQERGALLTADDKAAAVAVSERQGPSKFVGVSWDKTNRKWVAAIKHDGKRQHLGRFEGEHEAAKAVDTAARQLRGEDAHGGRAGTRKWLRLNFPSKREAARAKALGMPAAR
eukprot:COSAG06_NODE_1795_length_8376_cov_3.340462_1_plen_511_part_00